MRRILIALAVVAGALSTVSVADAQYYYYDRGYYPPPPPPPPYYGGRYYGEPRYYGPPRRYRNDPRYNPNAGCPWGWTRQAGVCKPYTGR